MEHLDTQGQGASESQQLHHPLSILCVPQLPTSACEEFGCYPTKHRSRGLLHLLVSKLQDD